MRRGAFNAARRAFRTAGSVSAEAEVERWSRLQRQGVKVNPCNSPLHPAAVAGVAPAKPGKALSVQEAYDPQGMDFACGPAHPNGLRLRSFRTERGLQSHVVIPDTFQELPGIISPGILCTLLSCHANWASSIALMDKSILPRPPLMAVARLSVDFSASEYAPPGMPLLLTSSVLKVQDSQEPYAVDIAVRLVGASSMLHAAEGIPTTGGEEGPLYATGVATLHKIGAVRSLSG